MPAYVAREKGGPIAVISVVEEEEPALSAGADAFLLKPVAPFKLTSTLRGLLEGRIASTILLADDDEVSRYLLGEALTKLGYAIVEAQNGREALNIIPPSSTSMEAGCASAAPPSRPAPERACLCCFTVTAINDAMRPGSCRPLV